MPQATVEQQRIEEGLALERYRHSSRTAKKIDDTAKGSAGHGVLYHPISINIWSKEFQMLSTAARH